MKSVKQKMMAGTVAAALLIGGFGGVLTHSAYADDDDGDAAITTAVNTSIPLSKRVDLGLDQLVIKASGILDMDYEDLQDALQSGKSLASVSIDQGMPSDALATKLIGDTQRIIDEALGANQITQDEANTLSQKAREQIENRINKTGYQDKAKTTGEAKKHLLQFQYKPQAESLAKLLGITKSELKKELEGGKSLSDIAAEKGINDEQLTSKLQEDMASSIQDFIHHK
ncbi:hypothetical protein SK3146_03211 [Paenibacillus konkukensis]|uniref:Uncharacterized protein n=1 Tax=Paenibacillus konkukensis TaxID=2020716 RepID=A0ABY4RRI2_9BACL|nr:hypothetical protein [Paenibacillus konkukensis]UQZ83999.1 hypothetical protein SK3146_03211 [Paenibacillus konkukensis]